METWKKKRWLNQKSHKPAHAERFLIQHSLMNKWLEVLSDRNEHTHTFPHIKINVAHSIKQTPSNWRLWRGGRREKRGKKDGGVGLVMLTASGLRDGARWSSVPGLSAAARGSRLHTSSSQTESIWIGQAQLFQAIKKQPHGKEKRKKDTGW